MAVAIKTNLYSELKFVGQVLDGRSADWNMADQKAACNNNYKLVFEGPPGSEDQKKEV